MLSEDNSQSSGIWESSKPERVEMKRSKRVMLSDDILEFSVLPRLSAESLVRFKCVSRRWCDLISNNNFFILQQYQSYTAPSRYLFCMSRQLESFSRDQNSAGLPDSSLHFKQFKLIIRASCNGLIALFCHFCEFRLLERAELFVGNPTLQDWKMIPKPEKHGGVHGIGLSYDPVNSIGCYELVCPYIIKKNDDHHFYTGFKVFSSKTEEWKMSRSKIVLSYPCDTIGKNEFLNDKYYWRVRTNVLWFDARKDCSGMIPLPVRPLEGTSGCLNKSEHGLTYTGIVNRLEIEIWSMKEQQWSKLYHIRIGEIAHGNPDIFAPICPQKHLRNGMPYRIIVRPIAYDGKLVFFGINDVCFAYDVESREINKYPVSTTWPVYFPYKSNLIPLPGKSSNLITPTKATLFYCQASQENVAQPKRRRQLIVGNCFI